MQRLHRHFARIAAPSTLASLHRAAAAAAAPGGGVNAGSGDHVSREMSSRSGAGGGGGRGRGRGRGGPGMGRRSPAYSSGDDEQDGDSWSKPRRGRGGAIGTTPADVGWLDEASPWSTGLSREQFDGSAVGRMVEPGMLPMPPETDDGGWEKDLEKGKRKDRLFVDGWDDRFRDTCELLKQVREPGVRGSYLKESEKLEMYKLHKDNPEVFTVDRLARDYRVMRQRVHAILWLKELEEVEEKRIGRPLDDSIERLLDECPEFFVSHDREFHVASLRYKPDFKVMPVDWEGTTKDPDEVLYEISTKEDEMLYEEFVEKMNFNKKKMAGEVYYHKYSRRRPQKGWNFTIEKLGVQDKCRGGNAFRFVSMPDGSSRELNELEKMYAKRETPRRRKKILP